MVRYSGKIAIVLSALVLVSAGSFAKNNEERGRAFQVKGSDAGTVTVIAQPSPDSVITLDVSHGTATHLGSYTLVGQETINISTLAISNGMATLTAADGSQIFLSYSGQASPTSTPGVLTSTFTATITGGTRRFAGATGHLTFSSVGSLATGQFTETVQGMIVRPKEHDGEHDDDRSGR